MAKTMGAFPFSQDRPLPMPVPAQMPMGPSRKAVSGIMMIMEQNGTKTIWTFSGKIRFQNLYTKASTAAMINGTKTCPP